jgi:hypothetical protein
MREQIREKLVSLFHYGKNLINFQAFINGTQIRDSPLYASGNNVEFKCGNYRRERDIILKWE